MRGKKAPKRRREPSTPAADMPGYLRDASMSILERAHWARLELEQEPCRFGVATVIGVIDARLAAWAKTAQPKALIGAIPAIESLQRAAGDALASKLEYVAIAIQCQTNREMQDADKRGTTAMARHPCECRD